ncbi:hypothetical protein LTR62_003279 [Meristemomyces frigidus]|uniref:Cytochrome P450 monooxygenase n=1 Tax=Meristemomyces frigidus TaxID=1508187 RepID=A0AAN7TKY5_9PEZI|nr:hypothetical protein LTR62_003279 [Meristemomyces frigidus]
MFLLKGTVIIVNAWDKEHDPEGVKNPKDFDTDHCVGCTALATDLDSDPREKRDHYGYGAGQRFCPGAHLAERNLPWRHCCGGLRSGQQRES